MNLELLRELETGLKEFSVVALATIVQTWGSTPRKAGTKMLVYPDGRIWGTLGGGCSEAEVKSQARLIMETRVPELCQIMMIGEVAADQGMVCGGKMEVFIEPISSVSTI